MALCMLGCNSDGCIDGSGPIVSESIDLFTFDGFDFQAAGEVTVVPATTQQVVVRGEQNIIDALNRDVFTQLLFSYKLNPRTVVFLGYSEFGIESQDFQMTSVDRTLFVKLGYSWFW